MFLQTVDTFKSVNVKQTISTCFTFVLHVCGYFYRDVGSVCDTKQVFFISYLDVSSHVCGDKS